MRTAVFSIHKFEKEYLLQANAGKHELVPIEARLSETTASLAADCKAVSIFTGDAASASVLEELHRVGVRHLALRSAGFNHVDLIKAKELNMQVSRVPAYSPHAIAEHTVALMLALNRKIIRAHDRVMDLNFSLDGLVGFDMNGKTVGIVGTGRIGAVLARILYGFGCHILAFDTQENEELKNKYEVEYTDYRTLCERSDIITLHVPLTPHTHYLIDKECIGWMKRGTMLINTSRGGLVNTKAVIDALKTKHIGSFGLDVYEEEEGLFFEDHSEDILQDDTIARLMTFRNVLITSHQAFLTDTALKNIAATTIHNLDCFEKGNTCENEVKLQPDHV
jgi:D-lactate dehydrogenase